MRFLLAKINKFSSFKTILFLCEACYAKADFSQFCLLLRSLYTAAMVNKLIIFAGPSGTGKTTIVKQLLAQMPQQLSFSVSATTRAPRPGEVHGREYYFLPEGSFKEKLAANEFIEHEQVYKGTLYGTLKSEIDSIATLNKHVIFDIDVQGSLNIKQLYGARAGGAGKTAIAGGVETTPYRTQYRNHRKYGRTHWQSPE